MNEPLRWESVAEMVRRVVSRQGRRRSGFYAIEGTRLVERALRAGAPLTAVLTAERLVAAPDPRHRALFDALHLATVPLVVAPDAVVAELTEGRDLGWVLGLVRLPQAVALDELLAGVTGPLPNPLPGGEGTADRLLPVSYTHLDVYKRQTLAAACWKWTNSLSLAEPAPSMSSSLSCSVWPG